MKVEESVAKCEDEKGRRRRGRCSLRGKGRDGIREKRGRASVDEI